MTTLRMATRRSALALAQSRMVARELTERHPGLTVTEVLVVTQGDRVLDRSLADIGGKGLFVTEVEDTLREGRADFAVHSMKDLPADLAPGLSIASVPARESPYDILVTVDGQSLADLCQGARIGTSSRRRALSLRSVRPDVDIQMLRGNVDTRLRRLGEGVYDAVILAEAGVRRLGVTVRSVRLDGVLVPAVAQGALALESRTDDRRTAEILAVLHHPTTALETLAERAVMRALGGSCTVPMGALGRWVEGRMSLEGFYATEDGLRSARAVCEGPVHDATAAEALGRALAEILRTSVQPTEE